MNASISNLNSYHEYEGSLNHVQSIIRTIGNEREKSLTVETSKNLVDGLNILDEKIGVYIDDLLERGIDQKRCNAVHDQAKKQVRLCIAALHGLVVGEINTVSDRRNTALIAVVSKFAQNLLDCVHVCPLLSEKVEDLKKIAALESNFIPSNAQIKNEVKALNNEIKIDAPQRNVNAKQVLEKEFFSQDLYGNTFFNDLRAIANFSLNAIRQSTNNELAENFEQVVVNSVAQIENEVIKLLKSDAVNQSDISKLERSLKEHVEDFTPIVEQALEYNKKNQKLITVGALTATLEFVNEFSFQPYVSKVQEKTKLLEDFRMGRYSL